jgi:prepilin peptidase CpaA
MLIVGLPGSTTIASVMLRRLRLQGVFSVLQFALMTVFPGAMAFAAAMDLFTMTIPNRISLFLVAAFLLFAPICGLGLSDIALHFAVAFGMLLLGIVFFVRGWMGGGDAKLIAAASLWMGAENLWPYIASAVIVGGILGAMLLVYRAIAPPLWLCRQEWAMRLHDKDEGIPYGIALCAAGLMVYPSTQWITNLAG